MFYLSSSFLVLKHQEEQLNAEQQSLLSMTFCPTYIKKSHPALQCDYHLSLVLQDEIFIGYIKQVTCP